MTQRVPANMPRQRRRMTMGTTRTSDGTMTRHVTQPTTNLMTTVGNEPANMPRQ